MGGFFGAISHKNCIYDVFFGTDYHSHLGTRRAGLAFYDTEKGFQRQIHSIENTPFRTKFDDDMAKFSGNAGIGCISDTDPQPLLVRSHLGMFAISTVGIINNAEQLVAETFSGPGHQFMAMSSGKINTTELTAALINQADDLISSFDAGDITLLDADLTGTNSLGYSGSYEAWDYSTTNLIYLGFNTQRGPFRSAQLRRALSRGIDRRSIAEISFAHHAVPTALPIHPDSPLYHQLLSDSADYSPDDLVKGLEGQQLGSDGLVFLVNSENSSKVAAAQRIVDQLSGAGVSISLERLSWTDYLAALERGDFDLYLAEVRLTADFDLTQLVGTRGGLNYGGWSDPSTDGLLSAFRAAGAELRSSAAASLCSHLIQNAPIVPICFKNGSVLTQWGRLSGLDPVRDNVFHGLENWVLDP